MTKVPMLLASGALLAACTVAGGAQATRSAGAGAAESCVIDTTARWYVRQMEWLAESGQAWSDDTLRQTLVRAAGTVEGLRGPQLGAETGTNTAQAGPRDTALVSSLRALARRRGAGWPTKSAVGAAGVRALWRFALRDTSLQRSIVHRLMEAGPDESFAPEVATLEDRLRVRDGRKQLYGTQMRVAGGIAEPLPTEDMAHVDLRREGALLPPLAFSRCVAVRGDASGP